MPKKDRKLVEAAEALSSPVEPDASESSRTVILRAEHLEKRYGKRTVVHDVSFHLGAGEVVGLLGSNGAGKTTTFGMVVGLIKPSGGKIYFGGKDVTRMPMYKRAREGMAYLAQESSVFRDLTARENVLSILEFTKMSRQDREARAEELLENLDVTHVADSKAYTLSGGERRRVEICRALATDPKVFLLDEPFAGIDPIAVSDLQETVIALTRIGIGVLITDHNVRETLHITDRAYILNDGRMLTSGTPQEIATNRAAREAYLGDRFLLNYHDSSI